MKQKKYWRSLDELNQTPEFVEKQKNEFPQELPVSEFMEDNKLDNAKSGRRDFLKVLGFSVTAATIAASCEMPVRKSIPYVVRPEEITPGVANYYATSYTDGGEYCGILVKTREGRPIKIEGNDINPVTKGNTTAKVQASVLNLYDGHRLQYPTIDGEKADWEAVDSQIINKLEAISGRGGKIAILSSTLTSPSLKRAVGEFTEKYGQVEHVTFDSNSVSGLLDANEKSFGKRAVPHYDFEKADLVVSVGADFLGTWISPAEYSNAYVQRRKVSREEHNMNRHIQVEARMSLAGANADKRVRVKPSEESLFILHLYNALARKAGTSTISGIPAIDAGDKVSSIADELWAKRGGSMVLSGSNSQDVQVVTNAINHLLDNYGQTINFDKANYQKQGNDEAVEKFLTELKGGNVDGVIFIDANPLYNHRRADEFKDALASAELTVYLGEYPDETASAAQYVCPVYHYLEAWNDTNPKKGFIGIGQPTIAPLFENTRHCGESILKWSGHDAPDFYAYIRQTWENEIFPKQNRFSTFNTFWDNSVHDGFAEVNENEGSEELTLNADVMAAGRNAASIEGGNLEVFFYEKVGIGNGKFANNPWLQELPDPISKVTWTNYATVSPKFARDNNFIQSQYQKDTKQFKLMNLTIDGKTMELPVFIQPGQADNTIGMALGYGREKSGIAGTGKGKNVYPFVKLKDNNYQYFSTAVSFEGVRGTFKLPTTQDHHSLHDGLNHRPIVKETTLEEFKQNPNAGNEDRAEVLNLLKYELYPGHDYPGHHWGMVIDLNACIGCGACSVACQAENNVPVVGPDEVTMAREMAWIRIDRYYGGNEDDPSVVFQPMMCQHCDNAPCENVCPVAATPHSQEGLNQMAYNRCIGTRYCANNCPYKVRRFNWFDYMNADSFTKANIHDEFGMTEDLTRMVLNPDVTVRSRGVMEKCSFCVQRIMEGKLNAKKERRKLEEGDIKTACQTACASNAIVFGDMNNPETEVAKAENDEEGRPFKVIEEIRTRPSVIYKTKVRNKPATEA